MRLCVIPARGGSKGIENKNLRKVGGCSLVSRAAKVASSGNCFDFIVVSTDSPTIAREVSSSAVSIVDRPRELSGDRVGDLPVLKHALHDSESRHGVIFDTVVMLQPTSPLRSSEDVLAVISKLENHPELDWAVSVSLVDSKFHPLKLFVEDIASDVCETKLAVIDALQSSSIVARQQLSRCFVRNGVAYAYKRDFIKTAGDTHDYSCEAIGGVLVNHPTINIDVEEDLVQAERLLSQRCEMGDMFDI